MSHQETWSIRPAEPENAELLAHVHADSFRAAYLNDDTERSEKVQAEADDMIHPERIELREQLILRAFVNEDEERYLEAIGENETPMGFVYGSKFDDGQELEALYVAPERFGSGVARDLVNEFLEWCNPEAPVTLGVVKDNFRAQRFYQKMGFVAIDEPREPYYEFLPEITMIKQGHTHEI